MIEAGIFAPDEKVELIEGEILPVSPKDPPHASRIARLTTLFVKRFGDTHEVRVQLPLTLGTRSEPEPDFALVSLAVADAAARHPDKADLIIEMCDSSLSFDRNAKASLYAKHGMADYWVLNLAGQRLEVRRDPAEYPPGAYGWTYSSLTLLAPGQEIAPLFSQETVFSVSELLGIS